MTIVLHWRHRAACLGIGTAEYDPFFPLNEDDADALALARAFCGQCEARAECLGYAIRTAQPFGIWGGYPQRVLRRLIERDRLGRTRAPATSKHHRNARKTRCKRGHPFSPENTYYARNGQRRCRICLSEAKHRFRGRGGRRAS